MTLTTTINHIITKMLYHLEKDKIIARSYPFIYNQKRFNPDGILFEVTNFTEATRIRFFDDESEFIMDLKNLITPDDIFYDIGACVGIFSLNLAQHCQSVFAFEPEPTIRGHLQKNIQLNRIQNVRVIPDAISDKNELATLFSDGIDGKSPSLDNAGFTSEINIHTMTLDEFVYQDKNPFPTIMKIDIEGAEIKAIRGMKKLLAEAPPKHIMIEIHPKLLKGFDSSKDEIISCLINYGYQINLQKKRDQQWHYIFTQKIDQLKYKK